MRDESFVSYVFRPLRVAILIISLLGILGGNNTYYLFFIAAVGNLIVRGVIYVVSNKKHRERDERTEKTSSETTQGHG